MRTTKRYENMMSFHILCSGRPHIHIHDLSGRSQALGGVPPLCNIPFLFGERSEWHEHFQTSFVSLSIVSGARADPGYRRIAISTGCIL